MFIVVAAKVFFPRRSGELYMSKPIDPKLLNKIEDALRALADGVRDLAATQGAGGSGPFASVQVAASVTIPKSGEPGWHEQQIMDVVALMNGSPKAIGGAWSFLNLCADHPDEWLSFAQVHEGNENSPRRVQTQADLGAFTKYVEEVRGTKGWPMETVVIGGVRHYRCIAQISEWIRAALVAVGKKRP